MASDHLMPTSGVLRTLNGDKERERERSLSFRTLASLCSKVLSLICLCGQVQRKEGIPNVGAQRKEPNLTQSPCLRLQSTFFLKKCIALFPRDRK